MNARHIGSSRRRRVVDQKRQADDCRTLSLIDRSTEVFSTPRIARGPQLFEITTKFHDVNSRCGRNNKLVSLSLIYHNFSYKLSIQGIVDNGIMKIKLGPNWSHMACQHTHECALGRFRPKNLPGIWAGVESCHNGAVSCGRRRGTYATL
jgi:hypothetical protein